MTTANATAITVRAASPGDIPWLVGQLREFDLFFGAGRSLFPGDARACEILAGLIADHLFLVAESVDGPRPLVGSNVDTHVTFATPVGFIAGHVGEHPFGGFKVLTELFWWVEPPSRGTRAGAMLLDKYIEIGRQLCADWILMTLEHDSPVSDRMLLKRGFRPKERSYLLEVAR